MSGENLSPNMSLPVPGVGITTGPQWASDVNASLGIIDGHDHTSGNGVLINPGGIDINTDFPFNGFRATSLLAAVFNSQASALSGTNFAYVVNGNLFFNDGSGNQVQMTSGGGVAGTPGSIGSLTSPAAATYSAGSKTFIWTADSGKAAAMDNGAVTIRETDVGSAKGVTLASASALVADYQLTLPSALPASTQYLTSSSSGTLTYSTSDMIAAAMTSVGADDIGVDMTLVGANAILASSTVWPSPTTSIADSVANARTRPNANPAAIGQIADTAAGTLTTTSTSYVSVPFQSIDIHTSGRAVFLCIQPADSGLSGFSVSSSGSSFEALQIRIQRNASTVYETEIFQQPPNELLVVPVSLTFVDVNITGSPGDYTYVMQIKSVGGGTVSAGNCKMVAYEI